LESSFSFSYEFVVFIIYNMVRSTNITIYSLLSVIGFIVPNSIVMQTVLSTGTYDFGQLFQSMDTNLYTRFVGADLGISALVFLAFYVIESRKTPIKFVWLALIGTFLVGLSFGFPLFLLLREINLTKKNHPNS
jgi:Terpene cyclase DEP1